MTLHDDLVAAKALIDTPEKWRKGPNFYVGKCHCAMTAAGEAIRDGGNWQDRAVAIRLAMVDALPEPFRSLNHFHVIDFNDHPATTHADVMALFDRAIAAASVTP